MANENKEEPFYQINFYLASDYNTDFSELNDVSLRSKKIDKLAEKLKLINNFRKNAFNIDIFKFDNGKCNSLIFSSKIEEVEDWFKGMGIEL
jgi:hypothetical protein